MEKRHVVIKSQFNINGSRGGSVKPFITDYVSRDSAANVSTAYVGATEVGDGVCFTLGDTAISKQEVLRIADKVENLFQSGKRAIQQLVISFDPTYLQDMGIVSSDTQILGRGDYKDQYDDVLLRHAIRHGLQELADNEGYQDAKAIGTIQDDTTHLHAHVVLYENGNVMRKRGKEEKGVIKQSSFDRCREGIHRFLTRFKQSQVVTKARMIVKPKVEQVVETVDNLLDHMRFFTDYMQQFLAPEPVIEQELIDDLIERIRDDSPELKNT